MHRVLLRVFACYLKVVHWRARCLPSAHTLTLMAAGGARQQGVMFEANQARVIHIEPAGFLLHAQPSMYCECK